MSAAAGGLDVRIDRVALRSGPGLGLDGRGVLRGLARALALLEIEVAECGPTLWVCGSSDLVSWPEVDGPLVVLACEPGDPDCS